MKLKDKMKLGPAGLVLSLSCWANGGSSFAGEPLFVQRVESAAPTREAIGKAEEQVREHKDVKLRERMAVPAFHKRIEPPLHEGETYCQGCHSPQPHSKKLRTRSFLNMHSRYVACETCHFRPEDVRLEYRWFDYAARRPAAADGSRFRTGRNLDNSVPIDGKFKIAPFYRGEPAFVLPGTAFAERVGREWQEGDLAARAQLKARLHAPLSKEGPACAKCHTEDSPLLDLSALGADSRQASAIRRHVIPQFFGRYQSDDERLKIIDILR
ncbi:multiheme c-type cytochrome [Methylococcus capsulatus]|jgi:RNase P subunit RPR2|uniref:Lipoprotein n=1 Tax=Methylococcus capsulatus TaxID=414 RepID=A0AA35XZH1_METCP|nr:multiheme c-type cytochrome [Methylococcus capsulatus]CAI8766436.1 putative lipoprotein [Methylococcus capsulatus]